VTEPRDRRTGGRPDSGQRRRSDDTEDRLDRLDAWKAEHDRWATNWAAAMEARVQAAEEAARNTASLLDGSAGNDGGIIGTLGKVQGSLEAIEKDVRDVKNKTGATDGQKPPGRTERILTVVGPILVVLITTIGGIVVAYFALRGQLAGLQTGGRP
jgi:hypothetical protein